MHMIFSFTIIVKFMKFYLAIRHRTWTLNRFWCHCKNFFLSFMTILSKAFPPKSTSQMLFSENSHWSHMTWHETLGNWHGVSLRQVSIKNMQLTLPFLFEILPQMAPDMRKREVHAVLTENQRGHHYLEGLDLLAWGGCHLGLSLQLDSSDTTLLLRTGTGRAWNVSGRKCMVQGMRSPYLL